MSEVPLYWVRCLFPSSGCTGHDAGGAVRRGLVGVCVCVSECVCVCGREGVREGGVHGWLLHRGLPLHGGPGPGIGVPRS